MIGGRKHFCWNGAGLMSLAEAMPVRCPKSRRPGERRVACNHYAISKPSVCELGARLWIPRTTTTDGHGLQLIADDLEDNGVIDDTAEIVCAGAAA